MTKSPPRYYEAEKSPLFRISSPQALAKLLGIELPALISLCEEGDSAYDQYLNKDNDRWIETPRPPLKEIQQRIHRLLCKIMPPDYLFSGYKFRGAVKNAERHLASSGTYMAKLDIRRFYPSSHGGRVFRLFYNDFQCDSRAADMLAKLCTIGKTRNSSWRHLPTGGVTSPILAYFAYQHMFGEIETLARHNGLILSVVADDITLSGEMASSAVIEEVKKTLEVYGLRSNFKKQKLWSGKHNNKRVTGVMVTPKGLRVPLAQKEKIRELRDQIRQEKNPRRRNKLYQKWLGSLSSAGLIESRFSIGAREGLREWKGDKEAWAYQVAMSNSKGPGKASGYQWQFSSSQRISNPL